MHIPTFQKKLFSWYRINARDMPWRRTQDPYKIWVSEIMLQQTQVDTVIPYFQRWIKKFPTVRALAKAPSSEVMKYWAGLGYYRRARGIHEASRFLVKEHAGKVPSRVEELIKLPGIGRYTAGAIASIAFGEKAPILDGNVIRVLSRIYALQKDIGSTETIRQLWQLAEEILPNRDVGDFNQALMELGATVCFPENPQCGKCPVARQCRAHQEHEEERYPVKNQKEKLQKLNTAALILRKNGKVLVQKQAENDRWGGLWTFPHWPHRKAMLTALSRHTHPLKRRMTVKHGFTKYLIRLDVYESRSGKNALKGRWIPIQKLRTLAFPSPHKKIAAELMRDNV